MITTEFEIIERSDKGELLLAEDRFGYNSIHYLVRLSKARTTLPEYTPYSNAVTEIQVRTILQHAWAEIEHDIQYKSSSVMPMEIRRPFIALAGVLEIADREFQAVQNEDTNLRKEARSQISKGDLDKVEITPDSLKAFLDKTIGSDGRMSPFSYDFLTRTLLRLGFRTLKQIEQCIGGYDDDILSKLAYEARLGQIVRFELMLLAGMGTVYLQRHPWSKEDWFKVRNSRILNTFSEGGVPVRNFDPVNPTPPP